MQRHRGIQVAAAGAHDEPRVGRGGRGEGWEGGGVRRGRRGRWEAGVYRGCEDVG